MASSDEITKSDMQGLLLDMKNWGEDDEMKGQFNPVDFSHPKNGKRIHCVFIPESSTKEDFFRQQTHKIGFNRFYL